MIFDDLHQQQHAVVVTAVRVHIFAKGCHVIIKATNTKNTNNAKWKPFILCHDNTFLQRVQYMVVCVFVFVKEREKQRATGAFMLLV